MKSFILFYLIAFLNIFFGFSQNFIGKWHGELKTPSITIRIDFNISKDKVNYKTTMDSPDQGAFDIPVTKTNITDNKIELFVNNLMISYKGTLKDSVIEGVFTQNGMQFPLNLSRKKVSSKKQNLREQDPKKPYPYISEDLVFINKKAENIQLAGTLTIPKNIKKPTVVVLISGSGPQDRNEEIKMLNHRPFLVLADYLTRNGIAVLRFDDRGVAKSQGKFKGATTADFASDVQAAAEYLSKRSDLNFGKIGLIGHSEGGLIATMVASKNKNIDFIVLLAAPGIRGSKILETQNRKISELSGVNNFILDSNENLSKEIHQVINTSKNVEEAKNELTELLKKHTEIPDAIKKQIIESYADKWMFYFVKTDPKKYLEKITCTILALNGSKDVQVLSEINLEAIKKATVKNKKVTLKELEGLNHLFQPCKTGLLNEYGKIDVTFSPRALQIISNWIKKQN
jgi:pimeloyl-ACP methyl ester carboxylesterase